MCAKANLRLALNNHLPDPVTTLPLLFAILRAAAHRLFGRDGHVKPLQVIIGIVMSFVLPLIWPFRATGDSPTGCGYAPCTGMTDDMAGTNVPVWHAAPRAGHREYAAGRTQTAPYHYAADRRILPVATNWKTEQLIEKKLKPLVELTSIVK